MIRAHLAAIPLTLSTLLAPAATAQEDVSKLLQNRASAAESLSVDQLWSLASSLVTTARELGPGSDLDAALDSALRAGGLSPKAELFVIAARLRGDDADLALLGERLVGLFDSADAGVATAAAALLEDDQFVAVDEERRAELVAALLAGAQDGNREPAFRMECATSAILRGDGAQRREGRVELLAFLNSSDPELRGQAALALARVGDRETAREELERLAELPGADGRLAASLIQQEEIIEHKERQKRNLREYFMEKLDKAGGAGSQSRESRMVENLIQMVEQRHLEGDTFDRDELITAALDGLLRGLDRHSAYMTPEEYKEFRLDLLAPEYGGIGAYVQNDPDDEIFTITRPIYSGPAYGAGLLTGDKIVRIDDWPTLGETTDDIIKRLKGKPGTPVKLYIWKRGMDGSLIERPTEDMAVTITRDRIVIPPVQHELLPGGVGLVELTTFSRGCSGLVREALEEMMDQGMTSVILDLRRNLGGLLTEARDLTDLFLPAEKLVVYTESRTEPKEQFFTMRPALVPEDMPVVVLIDRFSASASEIVSGALQDHGRATIVGQRSFGKGSVQNLFPLRGERSDEFFDENHNQMFDEWERITKDWNDNGEFDYAPQVRMTISRYMLPSGRSIHREVDREGELLSPGGVEPDLGVAPRRWAQWKLEEMNRITRDRSVREWADEHYEDHREEFIALARSDMHEAARYPGFDEFYQSLDTVLPEEDVRFLMRVEVRRRVQDDRGAAFPSGDYQEDPMMQEAIRELFVKRGGNYFDVEEYSTVFDLSPRRKEKPKNVATAEVDRAELQTALALLTEARKDDGKLSPEAIQELIELLNSLDD